MGSIAKGGTLPDTGVTKNQIYALVDNATFSGIVNADCAAGMALADTKLAQITTASKVSGAALTALANIPSGAGQVPVANLGTGTGSASNFLRGDGSWQGITALGTLDTSSYANNTAYLAATDGFVIAKCNATGNLIGLTDAANPPTTMVVDQYASGSQATIVYPVKKGNYWKVTGATGTGAFVYWIPLGA